MSVGRPKESPSLTRPGRAGRFNRGVAAVVSALGLLGSSAVAAEPVDYTRDVKPLLRKSCFACHGALKQAGGLRLDSGSKIVRGGDGGPVLRPGAAADSELFARVSSGDETLRMPQEGERLKPGQIAILKRWIDEGAKFPADDPPETDPADHWALRPVARSAPPQSASGNLIDGFLGAKLAEAGIEPLNPADRRTLLRRVALDLTGLPPTRQELAAFEADLSPLAYERAVDRLLASPQYGERWGRHWMDIWRYSDWWGLGAEVRNSQKHIWRWRDWIVESLNADRGYDEMVRDMLAADELAPADIDRLRAGGFLARHYFRFNRTTWLDETIEHTAKAFLGLTMNCAKCHDHKYDPITQVDYYRFRAIFEPYRVRLDQWPGEADLERDGVPRPYDGAPDDLTHLHIRGDDRNPDASRAMPPGVPAIFDRAGLGPFAVQPVALPPEGHQPGLRPYVLANYLKQAEAQIAAARAGLEAARTTLHDSEAHAAREATVVAVAELPRRPLVRDDFAGPNADRWETGAGEWRYADGRLRQMQDGDVRGALRLKGDVPSDFEARVRFRILGGKTWKSVGVTFDAADDRESLVYLSATAAGPKLQVAYKPGTAYQYPADGMQPRQVPLNEPHELVIRVRGTLVNASVNGEAALAYRLPVARRPGRMELITYDAQAEFLSFELSPLEASAELAEKSASPPAQATAPIPVVPARLAVRLAQTTLDAAELEPPALRARAAADAAVARSPGSPEAAELVRQAALAERRVAAAKAAEDAARAELELAKSDASKRADAEKKLATARDAAAKAAALDAPDATHTPLRGGLKTVESPVETKESQLRPFPATSTGRRTALATWITDPRHPLTPRVAVNHIWSRHFGTPLVPTVFDFGRRAPEPTHRQLLDYLAAELIGVTATDPTAGESAPSASSTSHSGAPRSGQAWKMKRVHRLIVLSDAYRRTSSSRGASAQAAADPENRLYWRMNPIRMEAQVVRDSLLALGGTLDLTLGGPPIHPSAGGASSRRSLYFVHSHNDHHPFLSMFDDASVLDCYRRTESIVPQQALALSNSALALATAERIATRLQAELGEADDGAFIAAAFETVLAAKPTADETAACAAMLGELSAALTAAKQPNGTLRARRALVQALLNHNDFVTIR